MDLHGRFWKFFLLHQKLDFRGIIGANSQAWGHFRLTVVSFFPGVIMIMTGMTPFQEHMMEIMGMVKLYMFMDSMLQESTIKGKL